MCGLVGVASSNPLGLEHWIQGGLRSIRHRGPDDTGEWVSTDNKVRLGHNRLAIIDLSGAGHQPMRDDTDRYVIVLNGEIYNFESLRNELIADGVLFHSGTDTEVALLAYRSWGVRCLARLEGMFALAIYDSVRNILVLARDRVGEKPLFYHYRDKRIRFASELKAILADHSLSRRVNAEAFASFIGFGFVPGSNCILDGFSKLPPASCLQFDLNSGTFEIHRYWELPSTCEGDSSAEFSETELLDKLENLLERSVKSQLVSDVPLGILLSGGVDSSIITALAARSSGQVKTYTVAFPGFEQYDESAHARLIANHFDTQHTVLEAGTVSVEVLPKLAKQYDEPIIDSSMIPMHMLSELVSGHCKVALGGDGGDEMFGGYDHYSKLLYLQAVTRYFPLPIRKLVSNASRLIPLGVNASNIRTWLLAQGHDLRDELPLLAQYFDLRNIRKLLPERAKYGHDPESLFFQRTNRSATLLQRAMRTDFLNYLPEDILVKSDRASMLSSIEMRSPFLDKNVIEFSFSKLNDRCKATTKGKKILLKKLAARILPAGFDTQRKQGFRIPLGTWLQGGQWEKYFKEVLLDPSCEFDKAYVSALIAGQGRKRSNEERLFGLIIFELWRKEYNVSF